MRAMDARTRIKGWVRSLGPAIALSASYCVLADLGLRWATIRGAASPVFPAAGVALAGLVLGGTRLWPAVFIGRLAAAFLHRSSLPLWVEVAIAAGNSLASVAGAKVFRWTRSDPSLTHLRDVLTFLAAALTSAAVAAVVLTLSIGSALDSGPGQSLILWLNVSMGGLSGILVMAPLVLTWARGEPIPHERAWWLHLVLSTAGASGAAWLIFGPTDSPLLWPSLIFCGLVWSALACGVRGAATTMVPIAAIAVWGTTMGYGSFVATATKHGGPGPSIAFILLQQFLGGIAITMQILAVIANERRGREALREREERLRLAGDAAGVGFWTWDIRHDTVILDETCAAFYGMRPSVPIPASTMFAAVCPEDRARIHESASRAVRMEGRYEVEFRLTRPDGTSRWIAAAGNVICEHGEAVRLAGVNLDVTARKMADSEREHLLSSERIARAEAERASRLKDEFLSTVSHELRTPLTAILGWSQILRRRISDSDMDESLRKGLAIIDRSAHAQVQLIEDLLDMSRIITGNVRLDVQPVDLGEVIGAAAATVAPSAEAKGIRVEKILSPLAGVVRGDPNRLQQVVWNLLSNAIKFTPRGGKVRVTLSSSGDHVQITVSDTGQGIPAEFLPYVFERFRQADASTTRRHGGLGLGLSIVKNLVELHGGTVQAASPGEGKGATFTVEMPLHVTRAPEEDSGDRRQEPSSASGEARCHVSDLRGISVLFVDDTADARDLVATLLANHNARVTTAASGEEALRLLEQEPIDVLVSDIGMPGMDGYELIRRVRALPPERGGHVPAVALTALARDDDRVKARRAGFQTHVAKPIQVMELLTAIGCLAGRDGQDRAAAANG
ncbi:ATP-binding protein [Polyangium sp. 6x1]|uniref:hybrid sensor histidine kinase/response regulator n=1 Tax=Polyangium sp. 6x1 TaxID=3042689 RepID=UPI002483255E|nr:ATP-binding protein [Polyangium sp. 6x1]MDI1445291.1 ATP-binding protein [Polyangium sp. 6x1]